MDRKVSQRAASRSVGTLVLGWITLLAFFVSPSFGYTTKSPVVVQMVSRAINHLKTASHGKPGGWALIGLALLKNKESLNHPKIVEAAEAVADATHRDAAGMDIYSMGLSIIFLASYDPGKYRAEIEMLLKALDSEQKPHGGWGYPHMQTGDTSMTQYGVLGTWEAKQAGFKISQGVVEKVAAWLLKTQDPSGAWGYQGHPSDTFQPIKQQEVRHSLAAAGLGSVYICADLLGMTPEVTFGEKGRLSALREIKQGDSRRARTKIKTSFNLDLIRAAQNRGNGWFQRNETIEAKVETFYYMYALERYQSFRELAEGKANRDPAVVEGPKWYNDGVNYLKKTQKKNGTWDCAGQCNSTVNTAFGALFLLRSTQKSIRRSHGFGDGTLIGGVGLPKDGEEFIGPDGRVLSKPLLGPFEAMKAALARQNAEDLTAAVAQWERLGGKKSNLLTTEHQKRFQALLSDPSPERRTAAVKMLVLSGNLDNVPTLIPALEDPDPDVVLTVRDGLRRLTRRFGGFDLPDDSTPQERRLAKEKWQAWYLSIRPDTEF